QQVSRTEAVLAGLEREARRHCPLTGLTQPPWRSWNASNSRLHPQFESVRQQVKNILTCETVAFGSGLGLALPKLHLSLGFRVKPRRAARQHHRTEGRGIRMTSCHSKIVKFTVIGAVVLLWGSGLAAQAPEGPQSSPPAQANPTPPAPKPATPQEKPKEGGVTIAVEVPVVTLDVVATTSNGDLIPGLKKENFVVLEDGQPQTITNFGAGDAPITMVILLEFDRVFYGLFSREAKYWSDGLFPNLNQKDWVALVTFDMKPRM